MSSTWTPLFTHFLPGCLVGWALNYILTLLTARQIVEEVVAHVRDEHNEHDDGETRTQARARAQAIMPAWLRSRWMLGALIAFVVIVTLGSTFLVFQRQEDQARCLRAVYDTTSRRLNDAGRIAKEDRLSVDDMVAGVMVPGKTPAERGQVLVNYLAERKAREAARAKLPPYPLTAGCPN